MQGLFLKLGPEAKIRSSHVALEHHFERCGVLCSPGVETDHFFFGGALGEGPRCVPNAYLYVLGSSE